MKELTPTSDKGAIRDFQLDLMALGYDLGHWGADGIIGRNTRDAAHDAASDFLLPHPTKSVMPAELVIGVRERAQAISSEPLAPAQMQDLTSSAYPAWRREERAWRDIDSVVFHQTAARMGEDPKRWSNHAFKHPKTGQIVRSALKAHVGVTEQGKILQIHPWRTFGWHAQRLSSRSIGIEVSGTFEGVIGQRSTWWRPPGVSQPDQGPSAAQVESTKALVRYLAGLLKSKGAQLRYAWAHRQSSSDRRSDPGEAVWKQIVLPISAELGLTTPRQTFGDGLPVPESWDPTQTGVPY